MRSGLIAFSIMLPAIGAAEPGNIAVLPVRASVPPTADPTMLRLTEELGRAIHGAAQVAVRVVSRELRDETCPATDGACPNDIASLLRAERVVSLRLDDTHEKITLRMYRALKGLELELELPCQREGARVFCDTKSIATKLKSKGGPSIDADAVRSAFSALDSKLKACLKQKSKKAEPEPPSEVEVQFQLDDRGRAAHVRIEPRQVERQPRYRCMARVVESLALSGDGRGQGPFRFPLPAASPSSP